MIDKQIYAIVSSQIQGSLVASRINTYF